MDRKKVVYISGPIEGVDNYWEAFEQAEEDLIGMGYIPLSPAHLPDGLSNKQYSRIHFAMIDSADAVLFLPGCDQSESSALEAEYCKYVDKPVTFLREFDRFVKNPRDIVQAWLKYDLEEVLKT